MNAYRLTNGRVYTQDAEQPTATAVAVRDGRLVAVGDDETIRALDGEWIDLQGRCVIPGLVDAHVHFESFSLGLQQLDFGDAPDRATILARIRARAAELPRGRWLLGRGWSTDRWGGLAFPTAAELDEAAGRVPVYLRDHSGHAAWVNSAALALAGIGPGTPDPAGGSIQRDERGAATGILFERAMALVGRHVPDVTEVQLVEAMRQGQVYCWERGLTGLHDFDGRAAFQALQALRRNGELGLRVVKNIPMSDYEHALGVGLRSGFGDAWLRIGGVKMFADGALGPRTAAMIAPYEGEPGNTGITVTDKETMLEVASAASAGGLSVTVHAIGDRALYDVLDVYAAVRAEEAARGQGAGRLRHRIEHVQIYHPSDLARIARHNIIASMQPIHATSDMEKAERHWGERARYSYAWRDVLDSGALIVFGSDSPIEPIDPIRGIHAAVTRRRPDGSPGPDGWYPAQRLTIGETIFAFTTAAALTAGTADELGSITPGKRADLTIFERDIYRVPPDELLGVPVAGTMVGGEFQYRVMA